MSILDVFRTASGGEQQAPQQQQTTSGPAQPNIPDPNAVANENDRLQQQQQEENKSPLDQFKDLWETPKNDDGTPVETNTAPPELTLEQVQKVVGDTNLAGNVVTAELATAITEGGEGAINALNQILSASSKSVFTQALVAANKLNSKVVEAAISRERETIPALLREQAASNHALSENPIFDDPAVKPVADAVRAQLLTKNPNATPNEITEQTQNFILALGKVFSPAPEVDPSAPKEEDWEKFLSIN